MKIIPFGAVEGVTGSCFLIHADNKKILIDCGLFQGENGWENNQDFPFNPKDIDYVLLTHAHLDHIGRIPLLVKKGFKGKIISTRATFELGRLMLLDAAKVMLEDFIVKSRKAERRGEKVNPPIYSEEDVIDSYDYFKTVEYKETVKIADNIKFTFKDAGHILGSAFIELEFFESDAVKRITFSGDLGNRNKPIVRDPARPDDCQTVFIETTYGDREHKDFNQSKIELEEAINYAFSNNGNVIIPTFALERAQELLYILRELYEEKKLPACKVFLDSPLAISATELFKKNYEYFDKETCDMFKQGKDPFSFPYLTFTRTVEDSKSINYFKGNAIIIAGSGMCNGGRILHHLKHNLWNPNNCIVFVGFQAKGTLGRKIVDGEKFVNIYGEQIKVSAKVFTINGFSSHADRNIIKNWLSQISDLKNLYLIHGEKDIMENFAVYLKTVFPALNIYIPKFGEVLNI